MPLNTKRFSTFVLVAAACFAFAVAPVAAKKKPTRPVIEKFEATGTGGGVLTFDIEEFSTDEELQALREAYAKGGEDAVDDASHKMEKGLVWIENEAYPIRVIRTESRSDVRTFNIVALAADRIVGETGGQTFIGHRGYPFSFVQLQVDPQGSGRGEEIPFAAVVFDKQGRINVKPMGAGAAIALSKVHAVNP